VKVIDVFRPAGRAFGVALASPAAASACAPTITKRTPRDVRQDKNSLKSGGSSGWVIHSPKHLDRAQAIESTRLASALADEAFVVAQRAELDRPAFAHARHYAACADRGVS
jgi:hypothetical protein